MIPDRYAAWVRLPLPTDVLLRVAPWIPDAGYVREECPAMQIADLTRYPDLAATRGPLILPAQVGRPCRRHVDHGVESDPDDPGMMTGRVLGSRIGAP